MSDLDETLASAYRYLGRRDRTVAEMRAHLAKRDLDTELIEAVIAQLSEQRYLDDTRFVERFSEDRRLLDHWGSERIRRRLLELGIERMTIESALINNWQEELERALDTLTDCLKSPLNNQRERARALSILVRRGYDEETAYEAVRTYERR